MKEKKHIDRIFQEKLKDFEASPNDAVWKRINAQLRKDEGERKVIPLWWKIGGIAAGILLMVTIGYSVFNNPSEDSSTIPSKVVETNNGPNNMDDSNKDNQNSQEKDSPDELLNNNLLPNKGLTDTKVKGSQENQPKNANDPIEKPTNKVYSGQKDAVVNSSLKKSHERPTIAVDNLNVEKNTNNAGVAQNNTDNRTIDNELPQKDATKDAIANNDIPKNLPDQPTPNQNPLSDIKEDAVNPSTENATAATDVPKEEENDKEETKNITEDAGPSIEEAIASSEDGEDYDEKEKEVIDRWSVMPNVSPVYYNSLGKGSSIHNQFNNNSKSGQLNMAYGVNASYAISDKLRIRSGINSVNVGYNTNDVVVYRSLTSQSGAIPAASSTTALRNIDLKDSAQGITVISGENLAFSQVPEVVSQNLKSSIDQEISFIEVPVELEYMISDKKLDVSVIGGFSTMILNNNNVYTDVNDQRTLLGEANNINTISYSANLGVGLGVRISEKINLNFEPTFKYQINTFNNTSGDFKPYIIGVTSGLKFKF